MSNEKYLCKYKKNNLMNEEKQEKLILLLLKKDVRKKFMKTLVDR